MIRFGKIKKFYLIGGGRILYEFAKYLKEQSYGIYVFSSQRHSKEMVEENRTFEDMILQESIPFYKPNDLEGSKDFMRHITSETMGIGFGEDWTFSKKIIDRFEGKLLDLMGIRLPQYRGGAHYSWQILRKNRMGACNLQLINSEMVQGVFDSGEIIKTKEYLFPVSATKPKDYFDTAIIEEINFLKEFVRELEQNKLFKPIPVPEAYSIYFPRLYTPKHGWINWSWNTDEIFSFINAFDDPYPGASTFLDGEKVKLKDVRVEYSDGPFHPFQFGLVYRRMDRSVFIASKEGTIIANVVLDSHGKNIVDKIKVGQRFFTCCKKLEEAMTFSAAYGANGLKTERGKNG